MTKRQWWSGIAVLVAAIALATFFLTRASDDDTADANASTTPTTATPTTIAPTATPAPVTPAAPKTCRSANLEVKLVDDAGGGAAGSTYSHLTFTNTGATCLMTGWPGVSYYGGPDVAQLGSAADRAGTAKVITLAPHAVAQALLKETAAGLYDGGDCVPAPADGLRVYSPNTSHYVLLPHPRDACSAPADHLLTISAVELT